MSYDELTWGRFNKGNNEALAVHCLRKVSHDVRHVRPLALLPGTNMSK